MANALEVNGLGKHFNKFSLSDITFTIPKGYICGYVGRNGAGKTTTLNLITHQMRADAGEVRIDGITYRDDPVRYKKSIGYIGDSNYVMPELKVNDLKQILKDFYDTFDGKKFQEMVDRWELPVDKKIKTFSRGMQVRLMFAGVFARDTKLLILDEATNGLDPVMKQEVLELLQAYIEDGEHSVLFSTHILSDLEQIADYIFFLEKGKRVLFDTREELTEKYVLVRGGLEDLDGKWQEKVLGLKESSLGFEGVMESDDAMMLPKACLIEKPTIDQLVVYMIREMEGERV